MISGVTSCVTPAFLPHWPAKPMSLSNHKWQMTYCQSSDTFQMEHMETLSTHPYYAPPTPFLPPPPTLITPTPPLLPGSISISTFAWTLLQCRVMYNYALTIVLCMLCQWSKDQWSYFFTQRIMYTEKACNCSRQAHRGHPSCPWSQSYSNKQINCEDWRRVQFL